MLANIQRQEVHLVVNPAKSTLRGWTDVFVVPPAAGQTTVGFHAIGHTITSVAVNGVPAEFTLVPPSPQPELTEASTKPTVKDIAEQAYYNYAAQMARELQPELVIQLPAGWDSQEQHLKTPEEAKQQVLQQAEQGPQSGQQPQGEGTQAIQGDPAQGPQGEGTQGPPGPAAGALDVATHAEGATDPPAAADAATGGAAPAAGPDAAGAAGAAGQGAVAPVDTGSAAHTPAAKAANSQADAVGSVKSPPSASVPPTTNTAPLLKIQIAFHRTIDTSVTSAVCLVPAEDRADSCDTCDPAHLRDRFFVSDPQLRRARELFPCCDVPGTLTTFTVHVTVPVTHVAVCDGALKSHTVTHLLTEDGHEVPHARNYVYESEVPVNVSRIVLAAGPMCVVQIHGGGAKGKHKEGPAGAKAAVKHHVDKDKDNGLPQITCFGPPGQEALVTHTTRSLPLILRVYEKYLETKFPFRQLKVVFVPAAAMRARDPPVLAGSNTILVSSSLLIGPDALDATITSTLALAHGVASCIYGGLMQADTSDDQWVVDGIVAHLTDKFIGAWLGKNELAWRRFKERQAVAQAENGGVPPLCASPLPSLASNVKTSDNPDTRLTPPVGVTVGHTYGTETLDLGPLRRWKASAVICMFERRVGEDAFKRVLSSVLSNAPKSSSVKLRNIRSAKFMTTLQKNTPAKIMEAFAQRWIFGRGCPEFELGFVYKRNNTIDIGLRQSASRAYYLAASAALRVVKSRLGDDDGSSIKVVVYEADARSEVDIKLTSPLQPFIQYVTVQNKELQTKVAVKRQGQRKGKGQKEEIKEEHEEPDAGPKLPMVYVRLDPDNDWLCNTRTYQPEQSWVAQLEKSKDVVAQSQAVAGLASLLQGEFAVSSANALAACLKNTNVFCRIRVEAALALGLLGSTDIALRELQGYLHSALYDPATLSLKPNTFSDLSEYQVITALPIALGLLRIEGEERSPQEAMRIILDFLDNSDNTGNQFSDAGLIAAFIEAVGHMQPGTGEQLATLLRALDRWLALEDLSPSPNFIIGVACLSAMQRLAARLSPGTEGTGEAREGVRQTLLSYAQKGVPLGLRTAAACTLLAHAVASTSEEKGTALLECLMSLKELGGWGASGRAALVAAAFNTMGDALQRNRIGLRDDEVEKQETENRTAASAASVEQLYGWLREARDAVERHSLFMLLQRVAKRDPTLYLAREEEEPVEAGPAQPENTIRSGGPAQTAGARTQGGPAMSGATTGATTAGGGTAAAARAAAGSLSRIKFKLPAGLAAGQAGSGGTVGAVVSSGAGAPGSPARSHLTSRVTPTTSHQPQTEGAPSTKMDTSVGQPTSHSQPPAGAAVTATTGQQSAAAAAPQDDEVVQPLPLPQLPPSSPPRDPRTARGAASALPAAPSPLPLGTSPFTHAAYAAAVDEASPDLRQPRQQPAAVVGAAAAAAVDAAVAAAAAAPQSPPAAAAGPRIAAEAGTTPNSRPGAGTAAAAAPEPAAAAAPAAPFVPTSQPAQAAAGTQPELAAVAPAGTVAAGAAKPGTKIRFPVKPRPALAASEAQQPGLPSGQQPVATAGAGPSQPAATAAASGPAGQAGGRPSSDDGTGAAAMDVQGAGAAPTWPAGVKRKRSQTPDRAGASSQPVAPAPAAPPAAATVQPPVLPAATAAEPPAAPAQPPSAPQPQQLPPAAPVGGNKVKFKTKYGGGTAAASQAAAAGQAAPAEPAAVAAAAATVAVAALASRPSAPMLPPAPQPAAAAVPPASAMPPAPSAPTTAPTQGTKLKIKIGGKSLATQPSVASGGAGAGSQSESQTQGAPGRASDDGQGPARKKPKRPSQS